MYHAPMIRAPIRPPENTPPDCRVCRLKICRQLPKRKYSHSLTTSRILAAKNPGQHHQNPEIPCVVTVDALLLGVADADPKPNQHAGRDQQAVGRQAEVANVKESREAL